MNQYSSILLHITTFNVMLNWELQNIAQYYMDITILLNITCTLGSIQFNTTEYYIQYYSISHAKSYNITCILGSIQYNITQYSMGFIKITQNCM